MNSSLVPLLLAYGEGLPDDATTSQGDAASVEEALLRTTRAALDGLPRPAPPRSAVDAVMEAARAAAAGSSLAGVRAVMAGDERASESVEDAVLRTTWAAVSGLERPAPPANVIEAIVRHAASAARESDLSPLRRSLAGERVAATDIEGRLLATTLEAVSRQPRPAPPADAVAAVLAAAARAARESDLAPVRAALSGEVASDGTEEALLRTTWQAVEKTPRQSPPVEAVHAVLAAANAALPPSRRAQTRSDRAALGRWSTIRLFAYATTAFAFVGLVSIGLWVSRDGRTELASRSTVAEELATAPAQPPSLHEQASTAEGSGAAEAEMLAAAPSSPPALVTDARGGAGAGRAAAFSPAQAPPPPPPPAPTEVRFARAEMEEAARQDVLRPAAGVGLVSADAGADTSPGAGLAGTPAVAPSWEAGADVRMLSLRLAAIQEQNAGVDWEEPPTAIGGPEDGGRTPAGFDAVGTRSAPARFQVRVSPND